MFLNIVLAPTNDTLVGSKLIAIIVAISIIVVYTNFYIINKEKPKIDQGFCLAYHKLSYRRRFVREMWSIPFIFLVLAIKYPSINLSAMGVAILFVLLFVAIIKSIYNYKMWKKHETKKER